jgi:hypothetical protein
MKLPLILIALLTVAIAGCTDSDGNTNGQMDENPITGPPSEIPPLENATITKALTISGYMTPTGWQPITPSSTVNNNCLDLDSYSEAGIDEIIVSLEYSSSTPSLVSEWRLGAISWEHEEEEFVTGTLPLQFEISNATEFFTQDPDDFIAIYAFPIDALPSVALYEELNLIVNVRAIDVDALEYSQESSTSCT